MRTKIDHLTACDTIKLMTMTTFIVFAAVFLSLQAIVFALLARFLAGRALKLFQEEEARIKSDVHDSIMGFFLPAKEGEQSQFGALVDSVSERFADTVFRKLKMSALGKAGGEAERHPAGAGLADIAGGLMGGGEGGITGNKVIDLMINRFVGGAQPAGGDHNNGHKSSGSQKLGF